MFGGSFRDYDAEGLLFEDVAGNISLSDATAIGNSIGVNVLGAGLVNFSDVRGTDQDHDFDGGLIDTSSPSFASASRNCAANSSWRTAMQALPEEATALYR